MTTITLPEARTATTPPSATLWTLARFEAKRYAKHPLFLAGLALAIITSLIKSGPDELDYHVIPSFFIGVVGIIIAGRLASATRRSEPVIDAAPVNESMRTAALCLACLVPAAAGVFLVVLHRIYIAANPYPNLDYGTYGTFDRYLITMVVPVIACAGAPLLGIAVARWLRFPGASLLAAVVVVLWSAVSAYIQQGGSAPTSGFKQIVHMLTPYTAFGASDANSNKARDDHYVVHRIGRLVRDLDASPVRSCGDGGAVAQSRDVASYGRPDVHRASSMRSHRARTRGRER